ncbi:MAG: GGDEF domain-containing protein, partial [Selenomonadaceae bacterium]|nr:GGDEF domain-containing protein [Selenomonadaceae bacterium]
LAIAGEMAGLHGFDRCISLYYLMVVFLEPIAFILVLSSASGGNAYSRSMAVPLLGFTALSLMDGFSMYFNVFAWQNFFTAFSVYFLAVFVLGILYEQFAQEKRLFMDARLLKNEMKEATELSSYDTLTKCYNRTRLNELLQRGLADSYDNGRPFAMLMFDLDHFKSFNDTFGHEMGDAVLAGFAGVVRQCTLSGQSFIRWGGEEFVLFCPECPISSAILLANVIRCRVMLTELCKERQVTCSIGITLWRGAGDSKETMFERADRALYKAKNNGRNRVEVEL